MSVIIHYFSFNQKRADKLWADFADDLAKVTAGEEIEMFMDPLKALTYPDDVKNESYALHNLKLLDLNYGSVHCEPIEDSGFEWPILEALSKVSKINLRPENFSKEEWLQIYSGIDNGFIYKVAQILAKDMSLEFDESEDYIIDFLAKVKPLIKDLKENEDSIFVAYAETSNEVSPDSAENILMQRAKEHWEKYQKVITSNAI